MPKVLKRLPRGPDLCGPRLSGVGSLEMKPSSKPIAADS